MGNTAVEVRDAMVGKLAPVAAQNGGVANSVSAYEGSLEGLTSGKNCLIVYPAVLVLYTGSTFEVESAPSFERVMRFSVLHVSTKLEGGVIDLVESTRALLTSSSLALAITPLVVGKEFYTELKGGVAVCGVEYITTTEFEATPS